MPKCWRMFLSRSGLPGARRPRLSYCLLSRRGSTPERRLLDDPDVGLESLIRQKVPTCWQKREGRNGQGD